MLEVTKDMVMPTTITGSYPKPNWFNQGLRGRPFKVGMADSLYREQYLDAVSTIINDQAMAGLDIVTDGDCRYDLTVGGQSWMAYVLERLGGLSGREDTSPWYQEETPVKPGHILWEIQETYQTPIVADKLQRGRLEYSAIWKVAQRMTEKPVKIGAISAQCLARVMSNRYYPSDKEFLLDLCDVLNEELRELADSGCPLIQIEEPMHHYAALNAGTTDKDLEFLTEAFNREVRGVNAEIWVHTCWGNPSQQRLFWETPSYERAIPHLLELDADVITFDCTSSNGQDLPLLGKYETSKKICIGAVSHTDSVVEPPEKVADLIRKALDFVPPERLVLSSDCGFGREGLSRRVAFYKCVALVQGANLVRRELNLSAAPIRAEDPLFAFAKLADKSPE